MTADVAPAAMLGGAADDLRLRAAVLSHFELPWLGGAADAEAIDRLLADCDRIAGPDGVRHWALADSARRDILKAAGPSLARQAWQALQHRPDTPEQRVIDQYLGATRPVTLSGTSSRHAQAAEAVLRWLGVLGAPAPSDWELSSRAGRDAILVPLQALAGSHFTGRAAILARLANDLRYAPGKMLIYGIGGIGKSTIAARHVLAAAENGTAVCYLTFDHASIDPAQPELILAALCRQLATQLNEPASRSVNSLAEVTSRRRRMQTEKSESPHSASGAAVESSLQDLAGQLAGKRCLMVLDALEEAQRRGLPAIRTVLDLVNRMHRLLPGSQILLLGRAPLEEATRDELAQVHLEGLDFGEAVSLLGDLLDSAAGPPDPDLDLRAVIRQVGTSPLCVHLAAGVLAKAPQDEAFRDLALVRGTMEGELYRRLLGHIDDLEVRRLAHPGLTLRRVTPDLIRWVLAGPCEVRVPDDATARRLFAGLASEAMLVERVPGTEEVVHRPDVRSLMLGRLAADSREVVSQIHWAAVAYYTRRGQPADRVEELYHRLMLSQPPAEVEGRWHDAAGPALVSAMDELPADSRVYLAQRVGDVDVADQDLSMAQPSAHRGLILQRAERLLAAGHASDAHAELQQLDQQAPDRSPEAAALWIRVLESLGELGSALQRAEEHRRDAGRRGAGPEVCEFTLHAARLLERVDQPGAAAGYLDSALDIARQLPSGDAMTVLLLRLVAARLGVARRSGQEAPGELGREGIAWFGQAPRRFVADQGSLLRDLAAELGDRSPAVLQMALTTIGLRAPTQQLAAVMALWDSIASLTRGIRSGALAELSRASRDAAGSPDWESWAAGLSPLRLGEQLATLSEAAREFPDPVVTALTRFYQRESDIALIGLDAVTEFEFVGREAEIEQIEQALGSGGQQVVVHGLIGSGKTSLLAGLARKWQQAGRIDHVFRFSYADRPWTTGQIIRAIAEALFGFKYQAGPLAAESDRVVEALREQRHVLILDQLDSAGGGRPAEPDRRPLLGLEDLLARLRYGETIVLIGARDPATADSLGSARPASFHLTGLDRAAAAMLADRILRRHALNTKDAEAAEHDQLEDLLTLLGGSPLALDLVLPALIGTPSELLASLTAGTASADLDERIRMAIEPSLRRLSPDVQGALRLLAPFTDAITRSPMLSLFQAEIDRAGAQTADFGSALDAAIAAGLAAPDARQSGVVRLHPLLPYSLRRIPLADADRQAAEQAHYRLYAQVAEGLHEMLTAATDPQRREVGRIVTDAEYFNLSAACSHGLRTGQPVAALVGVLDEHLRQAGRENARRNMSAAAVAAHAVGPADGDLARIQVIAGDATLAAGDLSAARQHYQAALAMLRPLGDEPVVAAVLARLGELALTRSDPHEAESVLREALEIFHKTGRLDQAAAVDISLGRLAFEQGRYEQAGELTRRALGTFEQTGDPERSALAHYQLGLIAERQNRAPDAEASYRNALYQVSGDERPGAAVVYGRLGAVTAAQGRHAEAMHLFHREADIYLAVGDRLAAGKAYSRIGQIARRQERYSEAEADYRLALDIYLEFGRRLEAATTWSEIGTLQRAMGQPAEAEVSHRQALAMFLDIGETAGAGLECFYLGVLAQAQGRTAEAELSYRQALRNTAESPDRKLFSNIMTRLGVALAEQDQHAEAVTVLCHAAASWYELTGAWADLDMEWLRRERQQLGGEPFARLLTSAVPPALADPLTAALDAGTGMA